MQGDDIGGGEQFIQCGQLHGITQGELVLDIVVEHLHADAFGNDGELGADMAIADDPQALATGFHRVVGTLVPLATVCLGILGRDTAQQQQNFAQYQLGNATGVGEGGIEYRNTTGFGGLQINLIGADAKTADRHQLLGGIQHFCGQVGTGADTDEVNITDLLDQRIAFE